MVLHATNWKILARFKFLDEFKFKFKILSSFTRKRGGFGDAWSKQKSRPLLKKSLKI